jgi:hypothetical protein
MNVSRMSVLSPPWMYPRLRALAEQIDQAGNGSESCARAARNHCIEPGGPEKVEAHGCSEHIEDKAGNPESDRERDQHGV